MNKDKLKAIFAQQSSRYRFNSCMVYYMLKRLVFLFMFLTACTESPTAVTNETITISPTIRATHLPDQQATGMMTTTITGSETAVTPTAATLPTATSAIAQTPEFVWLPPFSVHDDTFVLTVRANAAQQEPFPMEIAQFWDYSPLSGRVVFANLPTDASPFGSKAVQDMWVYDYDTNQAEQWFENHITGASWSKQIHPQTGTELLAVSTYTENQQYDLLVLSDKDEIITTIPNASDNFAWSPDGQWLAYFREEVDPGIFISPAMGGEEIKVAPDLGGRRAVGELQKPIWVQNPPAVIDSTSSGGFRISFLDGSEPAFFRETCLDYLLWDETYHQLLITCAGGMDMASELKVLQLSDDLQTVTNSYILAEGYNASAWVESDSRLLLDHRNVIDWPVTVTPTAVPTQTPLPTFEPAATSSALAENTLPHMVWFQQRTAPPSVWVVRADTSMQEAFPIEVNGHWDYSPHSGRFAFAHNAEDPSDLWVYDYQTEQMEEWLPQNVRQAAWAGVPHPQTGTELLAVLLENEDQQDLHILADKETVLSTIPNISSHFTWSPDGTQIAYFRDGAEPGIFTASALDGSETRLTAVNVDPFCCAGNLHWAEDPQAIIYAATGIEHPIHVIFTEGKEIITLQGRGGIALSNSFWVDNQRQLFITSEGGEGAERGVWRFDLSDDLRTATYANYADYVDAVIDWVVPGERFLLSDGRLIDIQAEN